MSIILHMELPVTNPVVSNIFSLKYVLASSPSAIKCTMLILLIFLFFNCINQHKINILCGSSVLLFTLSENFKTVWSFYFVKSSENTTSNYKHMVWPYEGSYSFLMHVGWYVLGMGLVSHTIFI